MKTWARRMYVRMFAPGLIAAGLRPGEATWSDAIIETAMNCHWPDGEAVDQPSTFNIIVDPYAPPGTIFLVDEKFFDPMPILGKDYTPPWLDEDGWIVPTEKQNDSYRLKTTLYWPMPRDKGEFLRNWVAQTNNVSWRGEGRTNYDSLRDLRIEEWRRTGSNFS